MNSRNWFRGRRWLVWGVALLATAACTSTGGTILAGPEGSPVPLPSSDSTAPQTVAIATLGLGSRDVKVSSGSANVSISVSYGTSFIVWGDAVDPEGLKSVQIWGGTDTWTCTDPATGLGHTMYGTFGSPAAENTDSTPNPTQGYPERTISYAMKYQACPHGQHLDSAQADFYAEGINYSGLRTLSGFITINYSGP